jgi:NitT/TauT family transport system substrate-binding protein
MAGLRRATAVVVALAMSASAALAADRIKVAVGQIDAWANQIPTLGMQAGIFQKHGIELENFGTQGAGETLQAVISGSADIGIGVGTSGAMRAFARGAPVRVIAAAYAGVADQYWYVKPDSPLKSLADATEKETMAYSTNGSTSHAAALAFKQLGVKARLLSTGGPVATYTMTMTGQVDIGWGVIPFGLKEYQEGKFRIIARGAEVPSMRNQTVRVQVINDNVLRNRADVVARFMRAYRETLDWMYSDPQAVKLYAEKMKMPEDLVVMQRDQFNPKDAMAPDRLSDLDLVMDDAVAQKFLDKPLTNDELTELFQIPKTR